MKPDNNPLSTYGLVAGVVGQVGCMILLVILGSLLLGLALDEAFGTRPTFVFIMLLISVPVSTAAIFFYTRYKAKQLHGNTSKKEEDISE
ncbi:MAG: AtpZ/AtpI family protein [Chloroflexota bacterium]|nr:AtpZ/AtpI family protein [Chloroflexota bacterium]